MRFALIAVVTLTLSGCSGESARPLPTAPGPPAVPAAPGPPSRPTARAWVWVVVIEASGACVRDATIEIVRGQGLGRTVAQMAPCSYWDPDYNATFDDLFPDEELTLRASAPGYTATEMTVVPSGGAQTALSFELSRIQ